MEISRFGEARLKSCAAKAPGRILSFTDDQFYYMGTLMLIDESSSGDMDEFIDVQGSRLFKFPFSSGSGKQQESAKGLSLHTLKMLKFHKLLSSENACVASDSAFEIIEARTEQFTKFADAAASGAFEDPVRQ